jgi:hypothetical protein
MSSIQNTIIEVIFFSFAIVFSEIVTRQLPYSNYSEFVLRQEHPLTDDQIADKILVERLKTDGMTVDLEKKIVVSEVWQEQSIKAAIRDSNLRPLLPVGLEKKIKRTVELAWDFNPRARPPMSDIVRTLEEHISEIRDKVPLITLTVPLRRVDAKTELPTARAEAASSKAENSGEISMMLARTASKSTGRGLQRKSHVRVLGAQGQTSVDLVSEVSSGSEDSSSDDSTASEVGPIPDIDATHHDYKLSMKSSKSTSLPSLERRKERPARKTKPKKIVSPGRDVTSDAEVRFSQPPAVNQMIPERVSSNSVVAALRKKRQQSEQTPNNSEGQQ